MIVQSEAIVLKARKYRESSKLVVLYTRDWGKCTVIAKGARRARNKFGSALEPLACSHVSLYKHANREIHTLSAAEPALALRGIPESFERLTTGLAMAEAVLNSQLDEDSNPALYTLFRNCLETLNTCHRNEELFLFYFQVHLAGIMGFGIETGSYPEGPAAGTALPESVVLSLSDGAPFAPHRIMANGFRVSGSTLACLGRLARAELDELQGLAPGQAELLEVREFLGRYFNYHLEKNLTWRTRNFLTSTGDDSTGRIAASD